MTDSTGHLSDNELIDYYYSEGSTAESARHLKVCPRCAMKLTTLQRDLDAVKPPALAARDADYGQQVWEKIRNSLVVYELPPANWWTRNFGRGGWWKPVTWATACAMLFAVAFLTGRLWQRNSPPPATVAVDPQARQRVVVLVLGDHLDRSERLLVELNHAGAGAAALPIQAEARELLAVNRLVRQSATQSGDPRLNASLDRLERLLVEVANEPDGLSEADLDRLRQEMNTEGLLFDVRILRSRVTKQQPYNASPLEGVTL